MTKDLKKETVKEKHQDVFWDIFDFPIVNAYQKNNLNLEKDETLKKLDEEIETSKKRYEEQQKHSNEVINKFDELKEQINQKLTESKNENENDRSDYFVYKKGDIEYRDSLCDFCKYNNPDNFNNCIHYPNGKPEDIINSDVKCQYLELSD